MDRASLRFHNHRRGSFLARDEDIDELVEIRARQRTFEGAYVRTALGNLGYSCLILRVFSTEFAKSRLRLFPHFEQRLIARTQLDSCTPSPRSSSSASPSFGSNGAKRISRMSIEVLEAS